MWHRAAIGHAVDTKGLESLVGYFEVTGFWRPVKKTSR
jgi:hypothetical protein